MPEDSIVTTGTEIYFSDPFMAKKLQIMPHEK